MKAKLKFACFGCGTILPKDTVLVNYHDPETSEFLYIQCSCPNCRMEQKVKAVYEKK